MTSSSIPSGHPGPYIRENIIPKGMNVTKAAKAIGVGRPALSNLLNGNARLSPEMAAKLEKAFDAANAEELLQMQSKFDAGNERSIVSASSVRAFVPPFLSAKANDIKAWADSHDSRARLAALLRILVHSTCTDLERVDFPANDDSQRPGWDGVVECVSGNVWVPKGGSGWEFGTNSEIGAKANKDYKKSLAAHSSKERGEMTFVFVTPRRWAGKEKWRNDRRAEHKWKDVLAFDASDFEQWMEQSIPAQVWFANEQGKNFRGTRSLERCWVQWNADCDPAFTTHIFDEAAIIAGRKLLDHLRGGAKRTLRLAADSILEGLAFVYTMLSGDDQELREIRDRLVVFDERGPLTELTSKGSRFVPVATSRETEVELSQTGARLGGISIVPKTMVQTEADIVLDTLSGEAFRKALESMGLGRDHIDRLSDESGRSLTVLRRRLSKSGAIRSPSWSTNQELARNLFPFMLAGAWKSDNDVDNFILSHLAGCAEYTKIERGITDLLAVEESAPVWSIGSFRGVVSKIDALYAIHKWVLADDLKRFWEAADMVLSERDPSLDLPEKDRWAASIYDKTRDVSSALREGIADSLVILAMHGNSLFKARVGVDVEAGVNGLVRGLFANMDADALESQSHDLPRYAEAAPEEFLRVIESDLAKEDPNTRALFRPIEDPIFSSNPRVGLLWALDTLAWSSEYFSRVIEILAQLTALEPEDRSGNSPTHSLLSIFRCWMPQTAAPLNQRIAVYDQLVRNHPDVAWAVGKDQYESGSRFGHFNVKPKWRDYAFGHGDYAPRDERRKFAVHCLNTALSWKNLDRLKLTNLIHIFEGLDEGNQTKTWSRVRDWANEASDQDRSELRETIRVGRSRMARRQNKKGDEHSKTDAFVPPAKEAYEALEPRELVWKHAWLFKNVWLEYSWEDIQDEDLDHEDRVRRVAGQRQAAVDEVHKAEGVDGTVKLALSGNAPHLVGNALAVSLTSEAERMGFLKAIIAEADFPASAKLRSLVDGFFFLLGDEPALALIRACREDITDELLVTLLSLCRFGRTAWDEVEGLGKAIARDYWHKVPANWARQSEEELRFAISKLLDAKRPLAALQLIHLDLKSIESEQLYDVLLRLPSTEETDRLNSSMDQHRIKKIFNLLNERKVIDRTRMARLEFLYLDLFRYDEGQIPNLEADVNENTSLFCDAIRLAYKGKNYNATKPPTEKTKQLANNAHTFLDALSAVPGRSKDGEIEAEALKSWMIEARRLCDATGHLSSADYRIGGLLAHAPVGDDGAWPCEAVREAVNELYSEELARGIEIARYNSRGMHGRGEGGAQERDLADTHERWAEAVFVKQVVR